MKKRMFYLLLWTLVLMMLPWCAALAEGQSGRLVLTPADADAMKSIGADAILIGETMMRAADKPAMLSSLREAAK